MQSSRARIAIIGAGITGVACAQALYARGYSPFHCGTTIADAVIDYLDTGTAS